MGLGVLSVRFWVSPMRRLTQLGCERIRSVGSPLRVQAAECWGEVAGLEGQGEGLAVGARPFGDEVGDDAARPRDRHLPGRSAADAGLRSGRHAGTRSGFRPVIEAADVDDTTLRNASRCWGVRPFQSFSKRGSVSNVGIRRPQPARQDARTYRRPTRAPFPARLRSPRPPRVPRPATGGEEPGLIGRDGHVAAYRDRPVVMNGELHLIALTDVQRAPDLLGQRQLGFGSHLYPGADKRLRFDLAGRYAHGSHP